MGKRFFALLMGLLLLNGLLLPAAAGESTDITTLMTGVWALEAEIVNGETWTKEQLSAYGPLLRYAFRADGTAVLGLGGTVQDTAWSSEKQTVTVPAGGELPFRLEDGLLYIEHEQVAFVLAKTDYSTIYGLDDLAGLWQLEEMRYVDTGRTVTSEELSRIRFEETLEFSTEGYTVLSIYTDGALHEENRLTCFLYAPGELLLDQKYRERFEIEGDKLTITETGQIMVYSRIRPEITDGE